VKDTRSKFRSIRWTLLLWHAAILMLALIGFGMATFYGISRARYAELDAALAGELQAIAAVVIGGTLLAGGVGSMVGTLAGVLLLFVIQNLIVQGANLNSYVQQVVSGGFLLVVVIVQAVLGRRSGVADT